MLTYMAIAVCGILGCWARFAQTNLVQAVYGRDFPLRHEHRYNGQLLDGFFVRRDFWNASPFPRLCERERRRGTPRYPAVSANFIARRPFVAKTVPVDGPGRAVGILELATQIQFLVVSQFEGDTTQFLGGLTKREQVLGCLFRAMEFAFNRRGLITPPHVN